MKGINFGINIGAAFSGSKAFNNAIKSTFLLDSKLEKLKNQRINLGQKFGFASQEARKLNTQIVKLTRNQRLLNQATQKQVQLEKYRDNFKSKFMEKLALGATIFAPMKVAIDYESSMADVKKVVNFKDGKEFKEFEKEVLNLSTKIPLKANGLAEIVAAGGQLGIAKDKLLGFTVTTAKMSTAFDMLPNEAGEASAKLMNVFSLSLNEVSSLGDAINHLSDNTASKAKDIVNVISRVGGSAKIFGLSAKKTASLASAFIALGKPPEVAATSINALLLKLGTADKQGNKFQDALRSIGLSSEELKDNIKANGEGAITDFLEKIKALDNEDKMGILSDMFGSEYADDIALLSEGMNNYTKSIKLLSDEQKYNGSMQREFETRSATTKNNLTLLGNTVTKIGINFGTILLPALNSILTPLRGLSNGVADFVSEYPTVSKYIGGFAVGAIGLSLALSGLGFMGSFVITGILGIAKAALFMNAIFLANPIGLAIVAITGLIALGTILYKKFEPIRNLFDGIWGAGKKVLGFLGFGSDDASEKKSVKSNPIVNSNITPKSINIPKTTKSNSKVVHNTPTYHITVQEPKSDVDVIKAMKTYEQQQRNRSYEDD